MISVAEAFSLSARWSLWSRLISMNLNILCVFAFVNLCSRPTTCICSRRRYQILKSSRFQSSSMKMGGGTSHLVYCTWMIINTIYRSSNAVEVGEWKNDPEAMASSRSLRCDKHLEHVGVNESAFGMWRVLESLLGKNIVKPLNNCSQVRPVKMSSTKRCSLHLNGIEQPSAGLNARNIAVSS